MALAKSLSVLVLAFLTLSPAFGQTLAHGKLKDADEAQAYADAQKQLKGRRLTVEWKAVTLEDVVKELRIHLGRTILFSAVADDRKAMPISLELHEVSAPVLLRLLEDSAKIRFFFDSGFVFVTTPEDAVKRSLEIRIYDIGDLLYEAPDFPAPPMEIHPGKVTLPAPEPEATRKDKNEVVDLIRTLVGTNVWEVEGTSIVVSHNLLIVRQTPEIHAKIDALVQALCAFL